MKTTRREMGAAVMAVLTINAEAQEADVTKSVRDANARNSDTLTKFEIPMSSEPAFRFEP